MDDRLRINDVIIIGNNIGYSYTATGKWNNYIKEEQMFVKYDISVEKVPKSIAIIPLICNLLPIMWVNDLVIEINEIDKVFYEHIPEIKRGYKNMYPDVKFLGNLEVKNIIENKYVQENNAVMFSGGVDAFNTLFAHIAEKPDLITIFGSDVDLNDDLGIKLVNEYHKKIAKNLELQYEGVYSNFRAIVKYKETNFEVNKINNYEWWHDFQHGIALLGLTAPLAYMKKYKIVYIASSFTSSDIGKYKCASDPTIDNYFIHSSTITIHDGYEFNRQDKIQNICKYVSENNIKINIRACWENKGGNNCCDCEKCYRTIMAIIAEGKRPSDYGFDLNTSKRKRMIRFLKLNTKYNTGLCTKPRYIPIQNKLKTCNNKVPIDFQWFIECNIGEKETNIIVKFRVFLNNIFRKIRKKFRK